MEFCFYNRKYELRIMRNQKFIPFPTFKLGIKEKSLPSVKYSYKIFIFNKIIKNIFLS